MDLEVHAKYLGSLIGNFHSLEFILRAFLQKLPSARPYGLPEGTDVYAFGVGRELPENEMTSYDSLGQLIDKYNNEMRKRKEKELDQTLVEIRDALAHGRVSAEQPDRPLRLVKFSKPSQGRVKVTFNEIMSEEWFLAQRKRVYDALQSVYNNAS